jgi:thiol-disulfide isomerase/thioredoxin
MNKKTGKNSINGSPASESLLRFNEEQDSLMHLIRVIQNETNGNLNKRIQQLQQDSIRQMALDMYKNIQQRYYNFGDTVSSSASFMENYNNIEFEKDTGRMRSFITKAVERFPNSAAISGLKGQVLNLIHIYEKELRVGDIFPELQLPDFDGKLYSTGVANGKYIFIDFWSSYCRNCLAYFKIKKELSSNNRFKNLALISVALDDNLKFCRQAVKENQLGGIQLIDKDMWQGQTAAKIAIDSIPFNFLVGPDHRILAKAIPADSVVSALEKFIH